MRRGHDLRTLYGQDLGRTDISEGVSGVIAKALSGSDAYNVLDRLLRSGTNAPVYRYVDITLYAVLANLPSDVVRILPWAGVSNGPTGGLPQDFWQKIGASASTVVNSLVYVGQLIYQGLVALGTFLVNLGEAIWNWGMQVLGAVSQAVAGAVQAVANVLAETIRWVLEFLESVAHGIFDAIVKPIVDGLRSWAYQVYEIVRRILEVGDTTPLDVQMLYGAFFLSGASLLIQGLAVGVQVLMGVVIGISFVLPGPGAIGAVIKKVIAKAMEKAAEHWLSLTLSIAAGELLAAVVKVGDPFWGVFTGIGVSLASVVVLLIQEIYVKFWKTSHFEPLLTGDLVGLVLGLIGFFITLGTSLWAGLVAAYVRIVNIVAAVISAIGLVVALGTDSWNDQLPTAIGILDELITAASFGFAFVQAVLS